MQSHVELTEFILKCCYEVINELGIGFLETVYKKALAIELSRTGLKYEEEKPLKVYYEDQVVGDFFVDIFVENEIVVELKAVTGLAKEHEVQLVNYLNALKKEVGLLVNFGPAAVEVKRKFRKLNL